MHGNANNAQNGDPRQIGGHFFLFDHSDSSVTEARPFAAVV
jgi:hypothetical protein